MTKGGLLGKLIHTYFSTGGEGAAPHPLKLIHIPLSPPSSPIVNKYDVGVTVFLYLQTGSMTVICTVQILFILLFCTKKFAGHKMRTFNGIFSLSYLNFFSILKNFHIELFFILNFYVCCKFYY